MLTDRNSGEVPFRIYPGGMHAFSPESVAPPIVLILSLPNDLSTEALAKVEALAKLGARSLDVESGLIPDSSEGTSRKGTQRYAKDLT